MKNGSDMLAQFWPRIISLPDTPPRTSHQEAVRLIGKPCRGGDASSAGGSDQPVLEPLKNPGADSDVGGIDIGLGYDRRTNLGQRQDRDH